MKRRELIRHLTAQGCVLIREGSDHSWWGNPSANRRSAVPRHTEINKCLARKICRDLQKHAVEWLLPQATNGSASAQCSVGIHYLNGQGVETNKETAIYWLTKAANQGDIEASNTLAKLKVP